MSSSLNIAEDLKHLHVDTGCIMMPNNDEKKEFIKKIRQETAKNICQILQKHREDIRLLTYPNEKFLKAIDEIKKRYKL